MIGIWCVGGGKALDEFFNVLTQYRTRKEVWTIARGALGDALDDGIDTVLGGGTRLFTWPRRALLVGADPSVDEIFGPYAVSRVVMVGGRRLATYPEYVFDTKEAAWAAFRERCEGFRAAANEIVAGRDLRIIQAERFLNVLDGGEYEYEDS